VALGGGAVEVYLETKSFWEEDIVHQMEGGEKAGGKYRLSVLDI